MGLHKFPIEVQQTIPKFPDFRYHSFICLWFRESANWAGWARRFYSLIWDHLAAAAAWFPAVGWSTSVLSSSSRLDQTSLNSCLWPYFKRLRPTHQPLPSFPLGHICSFAIVQRKSHAKPKSMKEWTTPGHGKKFTFDEEMPLTRLWNPDESNHIFCFKKCILSRNRHNKTFFVWLFLKED